MARPEKATAVAEIAESFSAASGAVLTEYRGLTVKQLQELRRSLGENANYAVVKNTLTKLAAKEAGVEGLDELLVGPTAIAFINGDVVEAAKGLRDFAKANPTLVIKGGFLDGKPLDAKEVAKLADEQGRLADLMLKLTEPQESVPAELPEDLPPPGEDANLEEELRRALDVDTAGNDNP